jgi:Rps23 Pro-64 3,4-dihydroxylase Tpa1-like proline 4-hydroxylase
MKPFCQYFDVFGESANRDLYRMAISKREHFAHSRTSQRKHYPDWRKSTVIYDDQLAGAAAQLEREIQIRLPEVLEALCMPAFNISSFEIQLTSHNDGEYFKWHTDNGSRETANRVLTFVYYLHRVPKRFSGGQLVIFLPDAGDVVLEPQNDSMVFFNSSAKHEVKPVACPSRLFEDGRFTLNGWIRGRVAHHDPYFGLKIFSPPGRTGLPSSPRRHVASHRPPRHTPGSYGSHVAESGLDVLPNKATRSPPDETPGRLTSVLNLYGELYRQSQRAGRVDVVRQISRSEFYESYYFANRPVLLKGVLETSEAVKKWSPEFFSRAYGAVPIQITAGRNTDPEYETHFRQTAHTITMAEFVERLSLDPETNDFYLVARNYFFDNPEFRQLRSDLQPPPEIINTTDESRGTVKLWFGPKGTVTPLHYDEHSILFTQIYGRKQFKLIPSFDYPKLYVRNTYYSAVDPERIDAKRYPDFLDASVADVIVEPGDILFIPVGWFHWVRSLDISISATFCSFHVAGRNTSMKLR